MVFPVKVFTKICIPPLSLRTRSASVHITKNPNSANAQIEFHEHEQNSKP
ncbi:hypothetical protein LINPERPRIM_LOCUS43228 [Linum perenne]